MERDTRSILEVDGKLIEVIIYGCPFCYPTDSNKQNISKSINKDKTSGCLYSKQPHKDTLIYGRWKILNIGIGSIVEFSTAGKYNPGFSTTQRYQGEIKRITEDGKLVVYVSGIGPAIIPVKHIEKIIA